MRSRREKREKREERRKKERERKYNVHRTIDLRVRGVVVWWPDDESERSSEEKRCKIKKRHTVLINPYESGRDTTFGRGLESSTCRTRGRVSPKLFSGEQHNPTIYPAHLS